MTLRMDHFTIVTDQLEATRQFYVDLLGFEVGPRPPFPVDGLWLYADSYPMLHVISVEQMPEPRRGVLDHMAFFLWSGFNARQARWPQRPLPHHPRPGENRTWQVFFKDPNGVEVELGFDAEETPPADWKQRSKR